MPEDKPKSISPPLPNQIGDYSVESYVGHGSYGHVFRVIGKDGVGRALKWLLRDISSEDATRFEVEMWALQTFRHPAIPQFVESGEHDSRPYFVMTLAPGISLRARYEEQLKNGGVTAQLHVLKIAIAVLDALAYMQALGAYHRDVKDANVLATDDFTHITLIDFGFCRADRQPVQTIPDFWGVGAGRYCPPSKLTNPARVHPSHDVFAVGVLCYQLLTNLYPWTVTKDQDRGDLIESMTTSRPALAHEINSLVHRELAHFIDTLLRTVDDERPTASEALDQAKELDTELSLRMPGSGILLEQRPTFPHVIRDPIHGDIRMTEYEWQLLNTPEVQRLRWVKQLSGSQDESLQLQPEFVRL